MNKEIEIMINKKIKKMMIVTILTALVIGGTTGVIAANYAATDVAFAPKDSNWKVSNVSEAIRDLYLYNSIKTPVGEVINYMGTIVPEHYLECNGQTYNISDYPKLAEHIKNNFGLYNYFGGDGTNTFAVPNLKGEFLRGSGDNSHANQGKGANVGVHQDATGINHLFSGTDAVTYMRMTNNSSGINYDSNISANENGKFVNMQASTFGTYPNGSSTLYTTRPTNTSVMFAIRYE